MMKKCDCKNCVCLTDVDGIWTCDELGKPISDIDKCPEESVTEYYIWVREVSSRLVTVKAHDSAEAKDKVRQMYRDEEIVLDYSDYDGVDIRDDANDDEYEEL